MPCNEDDILFYYRGGVYADTYIAWLISTTAMSLSPLVHTRTITSSKYISGKYMRKVNATTTSRVQNDYNIQKGDHAEATPSENVQNYVALYQ